MQFLPSEIAHPQSRLAVMKPSPARTLTTTIATCFVLGTAALGCSTISNTAGTFIANQSEYVAYRTVRTANDIAGRLSASDQYLSEYPNGRWADELRPWYQQTELQYWNAVQNYPEGLEQYLLTVPNGQHAKEAREKLALINDSNAAHQRHMEELSVASTETLLAEYTRQRDHARKLFTEWVSHAMAVQSWGQRTSRLPHETIFAWRIDRPRGTCEDDHCVKSLEVEYRLPGGGEEAERLFLMDVVFELDQGMLQEIRLQGPALFTRLYEVGAKQRVKFGDEAARQEAIQYAVSIVERAAEARLPAERCADATEPSDSADNTGENATSNATSNAAFRRICDGWTVIVEYAASIEVDDVVTIRGPAVSAVE